MDFDIKDDSIPEEFKFINFEYCDQSIGPVCDDYYGYLYYPLANGNFMKIYYKC